MLFGFFAIFRAHEPNARSWSVNPLSPPRIATAAMSGSDTASSSQPQATKPWPSTHTLRPICPDDQARFVLAYSGTVTRRQRQLSAIALPLLDLCLRGESSKYSDSLLRLFKSHRQKSP